MCTTTTEYTNIKHINNTDENKASFFAELLDGFLEHREAPLLGLIQAIFGVLWGG